MAPQRHFLSFRKHWTPFRAISIGFLVLILVGTALLMLPWATRGGSSASFRDALFTATSAVCVTGLVIRNTATYWSTFGHVIIIGLIQVGGLGVVTMGVLLSLLLGRKIGLSQRSRMQMAIGAMQIGGVVRLVRFVLLTTLIVETTGAALLATSLVPRYGWVKGLGYSFFHAISAFCNAGFDLFSDPQAFASLTRVYHLPLLLPTLALLIIIGGIGFLTWDDIRHHHLHFKKYRLQSKTVLSATLVLILVPALFFYFYEGRPDGSMAAFGPWDRVQQAFFQAISPRTAGFNAVDQAALSQPGIVITIFLMLIGGATGSTAGGMKISTFVMLVAAAINTYRRRNAVVLFKRQVKLTSLHQAVAIAFLHLNFFLLGGLLLSIADGVPVLSAFFETASAIGTVGLSLGITPSLSLFSHLVLIFLMYWGRVGGLTLIFAAWAGPKPELAQYPAEGINVG